MQNYRSKIKKLNKSNLLQILITYLFIIIESNKIYLYKKINKKLFKKTITIYERSIK